MLRAEEMFKQGKGWPDFFDKPVTDWDNESWEQTLLLFHEAAERVPAYKDFLARHGIDHRTIQTAGDFSRVPLTDKKNYLRYYPLDQLCWDGRISQKTATFTCTSGSTGEPCYFPRSTQLDWQYSCSIEAFLRHSSYGISGPVLVIIGFGMGVWIGGLITYRAFQIAGERTEVPLSILTPGSNKDEILKALEKIAPQFEQVILAGYPPFIKDVLDAACAAKVVLPSKMRLLFAAEGFSDTFRQYVAKKAGIRNVYLDTMNIYGSADIGAMAVETPLTIKLRELSCEDPLFKAALFPGVTKLPTLAQFNPYFIKFEAVEKRVVLSGDNIVPLIRYSIGDHGGVLSFKQLKELCEQRHVDVNTMGVESGATPVEFPFVYVYEREDFSTKLYGAIIYPEHVKMALQIEALEDAVSGKCTLITRSDGEQNQFLEIHVELKQAIEKTPEIEARLMESVQSHLLQHNAEYHYLHGLMPERVKPRIICWSYSDGPYFKSGLKQRWVQHE